MKNKNRNWKLKYSIEWIVAFIAVIILLPLLILIAVLEKIQDGGDIFYVSTRIGLKGKRFKFYKFRGMVKDAKPIITNDLKFVTVDNDPRITKLGKILRLGFDELAQLFNVLKGDMCIIGPRPNLQWEETLYDERERQRLNVLPGITGLTQILDGRALHIHDTYEMDVRYVENSTILTDLLILLFTIPYSFGWKNFYRKFFKKYLENIPCQRTLDDLSGKIEKKLTQETVYL
jgi:lipopolysaccharide/colanic/teichoic acid biosynthesis glycosyltransferase